MPPWVNIANLFTLGRLLATPFAVREILSGNPGRALAISLLAGFTDAIDGAVARRFGVTTSAGAYFDPIVDKLFLSAVYISLAMRASVPWWLVTEIFARDLLILASSGTLLVLNRMRRFPPSILGKLSTFLQIALALAILVSRAYPTLDLDRWQSALVWAVALVTALSGVHYFWRGLRELDRPPAVTATTDSLHRLS